MDPATIATIASSGASILGSLGIGGGEKRPRYKQALTALKDQTRYYPSWVVEGAKRAGLHPLSVLGNTPTSAPTAYIPGSKGPDFNAMGQGIDRLANAGRTGIQRELDNLQLENAKLQNEYLDVQIAGAKQAIAKSGATVPYGLGGPTFVDGQPSSGLDVKRVLAEEIAHDRKQTSTEAGKGTPTYKRFRGPAGTTIYGLSEPMQEAAEGYGPIGGSVFGGGLLLGTIPYYLRDILTSKKSPGYWLAKKRKQLKK